MQVCCPRCPRCPSNTASLAQEGRWVAAVLGVWPLLTEEPPRRLSTRCPGTHSCCWRRPSQEHRFWLSSDPATFIASERTLASLLSSPGPAPLPNPSPHPSGKCHPRSVQPSPLLPGLLSTAGLFRTVIPCSAQSPAQPLTPLLNPLPTALSPGSNSPGKSQPLCVLLSKQVLTGCLLLAPRVTITLVQSTRTFGPGSYTSLHGHPAPTSPSPTLPLY